MQQATTPPTKLKQKKAVCNGEAEAAAKNERQLFSIGVKDPMSKSRWEMLQMWSSDPWACQESPHTVCQHWERYCLIYSIASLIVANKQLWLHHHTSASALVGAHIAAAAPGGPRYDPKMSVEERSGPTNGMWLCSNCHDTIDRDTETYPTAVLKQIKKDAEDRITRELGRATSQPVRIGHSS